MKQGNKKSSVRNSLRTTLRRRVTAAFRAMARGLDSRTAYAQTKVFYRSGRGEWTRGLT
jgi:hypothetical protein